MPRVKREITQPGGEKLWHPFVALGGIGEADVDGEKRGHTARRRDSHRKGRPE